MFGGAYAANKVVSANAYYEDLTEKLILDKMAKNKARATRRATLMLRCRRRCSLIVAGSASRAPLWLTPGLALLLRAPLSAGCARREVPGLARVKVRKVLS